MRIIAVVLALIARPYLQGLERCRDPKWILRFYRWVEDKTKGVATQGWRQVAAALLPLWLLCGALQWLSAHLLWGLGLFILGVFSLVYTLGTQGYHNHLQPFIDAYENQDQEGQLQALACFASPEQSINPEQSLLGQVIQLMLSNSNERVFAILFWFVLLGPSGALGYYLAVVYRDYVCQSESSCEQVKPAIEWVLWVLGWMPARLGALSFAVVGSFVDAFDKSIKCHACTLIKNETLLLEAGLGAIRIEVEENSSLSPSMEEVKAVRDLVSRSVILWAAMIAVGTLIGWIS